MPAARSEALDAELFAAVAGLDLPGWYYPLCDDFPLREGDYSPQGDAMRAAWAAVGLTARTVAKRGSRAVVGGRGRNVQLLLLPARYSGMLDVHVELHDAGHYGVGTAQKWARDLLERSGGTAPDPPFPRPWATSDAELTVIVARAADLLVDLARVLDIGGQP